MIWFNGLTAALLLVAAVICAAALIERSRR